MSSKAHVPAFPQSHSQFGTRGWGERAFILSNYLASFCTLSVRTSPCCHLGQWERHPGTLIDGFLIAAGVIFVGIYNFGYEFSYEFTCARIYYLYINPEAISAENKQVFK